MKKIPYNLLIAIICLFAILSTDLEAKGKFRTSRGGGFFGKSKSSSNIFRTSKPKSSRVSSFFKKSSSSSLRTGSKSSSGNVHNKLSRKVGEQGKTYKNRNEALSAFKKSQAYEKFKKQPATFSKKPSRRPEYIPERITHNNTVVPIVFYNNSYGYHYGSRFVPLGHNHYVVRDRYLYNRRTSSSGFFGLFLFIIFLLFVIFIIMVIMQASRVRKKRLDKYKEYPKENIPIKKSHHFESSDPFLQKLYKVTKNKVIRISDPIVLTYFDQALDFTVIGTKGYENEQFRLFEIALQSVVDGDFVEMYLFAKEVEGDFALFLGIVDHEGASRDLAAQDWHHLNEEGSELSAEFVSIFEGDNGEEQSISFHQFPFGAFYDMKTPEKTGYTSVCEYQPGSDGEWQHAIVTWKGDWIRCYYCNESHKGAVDIY